MAENITPDMEEELTPEEFAAELIKLNEQRADTYAFLARIFRKEIDQPLLDKMKAMRFPTDTGNKELDEGYRMLVKALGATWENTVSDLRVEYVYNFLGHGIDAYSGAYPFESVYTSPKRLMMQDARDEVLAIYRSEGLDKQETWKLGEDHISLELEFMEILSQRANEALAAGDEDKAFSLMHTQMNFMDDHLLAWVPMMMSDLKKFAREGIYRSIAYVTNGFLHADRDLLHNLVDVQEEEA